ncbi:MAG: hypothetical protein B7X04_02875 [Parcubacteria group bacterium 21-54-25]|nr:MAG: hypothetical protein B7X04_02875 [Parcubacteria group bacterium 21-54-25]HQU07905.1 hypothetical protein [Candidatus Paceibacterota bacterium]
MAHKQLSVEEREEIQQVSCAMKEVQSTTIVVIMEIILPKMSRVYNLFIIYPMSISREVLLEILRDACRAPSGDNTQPWRFLVKRNIIYVINTPEKDTSLFNWQQRTNYIALGACIENLCVSALGKRLRAKVALFPEHADRLIVAAVTLTPERSMGSGLVPYLAKRASNRKKYLEKEVEPEKLSTLASCVHDDKSRLTFITERPSLERVARIVSVGERLALENKSIHDFLFAHITWSKEEDSKKHGFFIDTFEFAPPQRVAFRLFRHWNILKLFLSLGVSKAIVKDIEKVHATAAAFGAIIISNETPEAFLQAGMVLERLWLTATKAGLSLQPTTTVHFLGARVSAGDSGGLSSEHQSLLKQNYVALSREFGLNSSERFGFVFRLGYADPPSAMTTRFEPKVLFEE